MSTGPQDASTILQSVSVQLSPRTIYLAVLPLSIQTRGLFLQLLQKPCCFLGIRLEQVVVYAPCIASVLLEECEIIVSLRAMNLARRQQGEE
jgi:hypothetical protein